MISEQAPLSELDALGSRFHIHFYPLLPVYATPETPTITPRHLISHLLRSTFHPENPWIRVPLAVGVWLVAVPYASAQIWKAYWDPRGILEAWAEWVVGVDGAWGKLPPLFPSLLLGHLVAMISLATGVLLLILKEYVVVNTGAENADVDARDMQVQVGDGVVRGAGVPAGGMVGGPMVGPNEADLEGHDNGQWVDRRVPEGIPDLEGGRGLDGPRHNGVGDPTQSVPLENHLASAVPDLDRDVDYAPSYSGKGKGPARVAENAETGPESVEMSPVSVSDGDLSNAGSNIARNKGKARGDVSPERSRLDNASSQESNHLFVQPTPPAYANPSPTPAAPIPTPVVAPINIRLQPQPIPVPNPELQLPVLPPVPAEEPPEPLALLDLLGVRGPISMLLQNATVVLAVVAAVVGGGVWWPFSVGRVTYFVGYLLMGPVRAVGARGLREVWKAGGKWSRYTYHFLDNAGLVDGASAVWRVAKEQTGSSLEVLWGNVATNPFVRRAITVMNLVAQRTDEVLRPAVEALLVNVKTLAVPVSRWADGAALAASNATMNATLSEVSTASLTSVNQTELSSAFGPQIFSSSDEVRDPWTTEDKLRHAALGYAVLLVFGAYYGWQTGAFAHPYARTARRLVGRSAKYLAVSIKVTVFIFIELVIFPLMCGVLIDVCTLPIFGVAATVSSRLTFHFAHPWTSSFLHWLAGTTYMFQFALYVGTVKEIVRDGVMWFIRDPNDPHFHPMMDIVERPVIVQLRKLAVSAFMYSVMVIGGVGGYVYGTRWLDRVFVEKFGDGPWRMWPLKWELSETISEFPIELLTFHLLFPAMLRITQPRYWFDLALRKWFEWTAKRLRLTSFLFGGTHPDEESDGEEEATIDEVEELEDEAPAEGNDATDVVDKVNEEQSNGVQSSEEEPVATNSSDATSTQTTPHELLAAGTVPRRREFRYMRVPNRDYVEVIRGQRMLVPWREGEPLRGRDTETPEETAANWCLVYVPAAFKFRIYLLLIWQWLSAVTFLGLLINLPLTTGRAIFKRLDLIVDFASHRNAITTLVLARGPNSSSNEDQSTRIVEATPVVPSHGGVRPDLPVHDVYSIAVGMFCLLVILGSFRVFYSRNSKWLDRLGRFVTKPFRKFGKACRSLFRVRRRRTAPTGSSTLARTWYQPFVSAGQRVRRHRKGRSFVDVEPTAEEGEQANGGVEGHSRKRRTWIGRLGPINPRVYLGWLSRQTWALGMGAGVRARRRVIWFRLREVERGIWRERISSFIGVTAKATVLAAFVGIIIPLMVGIIFELYIITPLRSPRDQTPVNFVMQDYALGVVYLKIFYSLLLVGPETPLARSVKEARDAGFYAFDLARFVKNVLFPITATCLVLICAPTVIGEMATWFAVWVYRRTNSMEHRSDGHNMDVMILEQLVLRYVFPGVLVFGLSAEAVDGILKLGRSWIERVRDEQFLVGRRLHNLEAEPRSLIQSLDVTSERSNDLQTVINSASLPEAGSRSRSGRTSISVSASSAESRDNLTRDMTPGGSDNDWVDDDTI
ncbi:hypothetical protein HDU93_007161 [Gonapodya sp. JEL0774]|nr:hypothetical protein HDU93_007161 [Gonapodya sp. JEL0774]